jgi:hypothetical protein
MRILAIGCIKEVLRMKFYKKVDKNGFFQTFQTKTFSEGTLKDIFVPQLIRLYRKIPEFVETSKFSGLEVRN